MKSEKVLKKSAKMLRGIERVMSKYGRSGLVVTFEIERNPVNRNGRYYDYAEIHCKILQRTWIVSHDGSVWF